MWRVDWCGSFSEFSQIFNTKEEAVEFYNSLISSRKQYTKHFKEATQCAQSRYIPA